jgi:transposase
MAGVRSSHIAKARRPIRPDDRRRRSRVDRTLLKIALEEIDFALAAERRQWVRNRLMAIRTVLSGGTEEHAAKLAKVSCRSVQRWLHYVRESGFAGLVYDGRVEPRSGSIKPREVRSLREAIARLLKDKPSRRERQRLLAVDAVLAGSPLYRTATDAGVRAVTLRQWIAAARKHGAQALLQQGGGRRR